MHDLETIHSRNAAAAHACIDLAIFTDKFVVETRVGLNFLGYSVHDTLDEATAKMAAIDEEGQPGVTAVLHQPEVA